MPTGAGCWTLRARARHTLSPRIYTQPHHDAVLEIGLHVQAEPSSSKNEDGVADEHNIEFCRLWDHTKWKTGHAPRITIS